MIGYKFAENVFVTRTGTVRVNFDKANEVNAESAGAAEPLLTFDDVGLNREISPLRISNFQTLIPLPFVHSIEPASSDITVYNNDQGIRGEHGTSVLVRCCLVSAVLSSA